MIRLLGFVIGSAVSIGIFLLILGVPEINLSERVISEENVEAATQAVETLTEDLEAIASDASNAIDQVIAELPDKIPEEAPAFVVDELTDAELNATDALTEASKQQPDNLVSEQAELAELPAESAQDDIKWHAFWNPFRSRLAAEGFVGQLEKVTGLDYRVVKIKAGVYDVTFAYENDDERREKMSLIASAAGLDLPES